VKPFVGNLRKDFGKDCWIEKGASLSGGFFQVGGPWKEDVTADVGKWGGGKTIGVGPVVMEVEGCAVVNEVELTVPVEEICVAGGAVDVEGEGIKPDG